MRLEASWAQAVLLLVLGVTSLTGSAFAATPCSCTSPKVEYAATALPQQSNPTWIPNVTAGTMPIATAGGFLSIDTTSSPQQYAYFQRNWQAANSQGVTVEARVRLDSYSGDRNLGGAAIWVEDDINAEVLLIHPEGIRLYASGRVHHMQTMDRHHTYRITAVGRDIHVYVDGVRVIDGTGVFGTNSWKANNMVAFGDGSGGASSKSSWDYVLYSRCLWEAHYSGDVLPQASSPAWTPVYAGTPQLSPEEGVLKTNTLPSLGTAAYFVQKWGALSTQPTSVETRMKLDSYSGDPNLAGAGIWVETNATAEVILIRPGGIRLYRAGLTHSMDTVGSFHTYCIDTSGRDILVYVDGQLAIDGRGTFEAMSGVEYNWVGFGDGSAGASSQAQWDFFQYSRR